MSIDLDRWQRKADFYANAPTWVRSIWSTQPSFEWYCKSRRKTLAKAGALRKLGRDWFVHSDQLEVAVRGEFFGDSAA